MKKDVIYVDIEDDITSVIAKVKGVSAPIVALVPPKRIGVLQSTVNLKLLQRAAKTADKHLVLITSDAALTSLAAGIAIPVAKNLQSKPEVPEAAKPQAEDDDVINGNELPVGDLAATAPGQEKEESIIDTIPDFDAPLATKAASRAPKKAAGSKVPNFDNFRKKIFIAAGAGVLLIVFLVWAIFFAPKATVAITAKTNIVNIDKVMQLKPGATLDVRQNVAPAIVKQVKKTAAVDFAPTGKKEVGEKATGTVKFTNTQDDVSAEIPAGTQVVTSSGLPFVTSGAVTVPMAVPGTKAQCGQDNLCEGTITVGITATTGGSKFNGATGGVSGSFDGASGALTAATAGGTDKTATVISQADIDKAREQLKSQDSSAVKAELKKQFVGDSIVIQESFQVAPGEPVSTPAVDQEATSAKLTAETTYTMVAVSRADLKKVFDAYTQTQIGKGDNQKIYESGDKTVAFSQFSTAEGGAYTAKVRASAQVGPEIDDGSLAKTLVGKRSGEIQQQLESIQGVEDVETTFSPFWVTTAPKAERITIKFLIKNE